ncbi:large subunit ribosomal protein L23 [Anaerovirgula multivorans]|uniref:Large ribosomal subunit protein uL23 n=1 Tax=Anaerovirgula multivorans TaxID=312168 RepID=A0A239E3Z3_9FIRM|nr:50S ribosomal protein L23 [Anaerovirgula multivorans]SNS39199.1 large subunit ribosomal protein L23 [Anaerovirgula multivorans]
MTNPHDVVIRPLVTEHSMADIADKKYAFVVDRKANKTEIRKAIEKIFGVKVEKVNTVNMKGKVKRMGKNVGKRPDWKKAYVTLTQESKDIELFEGM